MKNSFVKPNKASVLTINGGSSSIKFALYHVEEPLKRGLYGKVDRIGLSGTNLTFSDPAGNQQESLNIEASDHKSAANFLIGWLEKKHNFDSVRAVGHRVVHGMKHIQPEIVTRELLDELHRLRPYDPDHLPREIDLIEAFRKRHPKLPQLACFDTAFHQTMPRVAKLLPIPRRFDANGVQRYGFHGLSYAYLMEELARLGDPAATAGRLILAHLGNGASMAAVRAAEAVALFCYQAKKWIGAYAAALGGLDTLVFAGGIGENAPIVRARICEGLGFLGIELNETRNTETSGVISTGASRVMVRVIRTDEELMIARSVLRSCPVATTE